MAINFNDGGVADDTSLGSTTATNPDRPPQIDPGLNPLDPGNTGNPGNSGPGGGGGSPGGGGGGSPGGGVGTYDYEVVSSSTAVGSSYIASENSSISASGCVAVLSRKDGFSVARTSSGHFDNCVSYAGNFGFVSTQTSSLEIVSSVSSIHTINYFTSLSSSTKTRYSCSIFPVDFGAYAYYNSAMQNMEYESMTTFWAKGDNGNVFSTHFGSYLNSSMENSGEQMSAGFTASGFSGPFLSSNDMRFLWSRIYRSFTPTSAGNIGNVTADTSYRYVPLQHSTDYSNIADTPEVSSATSISNNAPALFAIIAYRNNYESVKPPLSIFQPEDGSGIRTVAGLTGNYSLSNLVYSGLDLLGG